MKNSIIYAGFIAMGLFSCKSNSENQQGNESENIETNFKIALGSCNRQNLPQEFWATIEKDSADLFIWGGDNIYADTADMESMRDKY